jgi:DNA-binding GntR family transcriptional regulator
MPSIPRQAWAVSADGEQPSRPRTLVDAVVDALIEAAARGSILPGDRVVEPEIARKLGVSRVPVREALRLLESQGVVSSEPYKGIRLMPFTPERLDNLIEARVALETTAAARAIRTGRNGEGELAQLFRLVADLEGRSAARRFPTASRKPTSASTGRFSRSVATTSCAPCGRAWRGRPPSSSACPPSASRCRPSWTSTARWRSSSATGPSRP